MIVPLVRRRRDAEENVLPLINIVFLLLIFFMIAGALSSAAPFELRLPRAGDAPDVAAPAGADIALARDDRIAFAGEPVALADLPERVRRWAANSGDDPVLTLRADGRGDSERLLAVIEALRQAGVERVRLLAVGGEPGDA
jgi:biopolymer transport protein ExbD